MAWAFALVALAVALVQTSSRQALPDTPETVWALTSLTHNFDPRSGDQLRSLSAQFVLGRVDRRDGPAGSSPSAGSKAVFRPAIALPQPVAISRSVERAGRVALPHETVAHCWARAPPQRA